MLQLFLVTASPVIAMFIGIAPLVALMAFRTIWPYSEGSSLTQDLLRPPGHSLRERLEREQEQSLTLILAALFFAIFYGIILTVEATLRPNSIPWIALAIVFVFGTPIGAWFFYKLDRQVLKGRELHAGLRGEMATGEELNLLMLDGYRVFHDVPIDYGNVDHVVVGPGGVYAVETKHIRRKIGSEDKARLTVDFDRKVIELPRGAVPIPETQLATQRSELSSFLSRAVGDRVEAESMLAIPGWYVERRGKPTFVAFNPKNPRPWFQRRPEKLSPTMIERIAYQLEQVCRDVAAKKAPPKRRAI